MRIARVRAPRGTKFPFVLESVKAGFPSPADDYVENKLSLDELLIKHPSATFFLRVSGTSMTGAGIHPGDILVVDRSIEPTDGKIIIAALEGELTVKRLKKRSNKIYLLAENSNFVPINITDKQEVYVWGVVTCVIHKV